MGRIVEVVCKKCLGQRFIGKGRKTPCPKCLDKTTGQPTGKFKKELSESAKL